MNRQNVDNEGEGGERGPTLVASDPRTYHTHRNKTSFGSMSGTVIQAIASIGGIDPTETRIPLMDVLDPDALDALFTRDPRGNRTVGHITFSIDGLTMFVHSNGHVILRE
ncbi:HalOD1 output domain-containing protein [Haladaptatus sp. CMAA 1911]|uniref:HalOD1 output domain-containing protein n=1 Tax=unclassified Haladaptatus TaxID=2622732 RepID=UPI0037550235